MLQLLHVAEVILGSIFPPSELHSTVKSENKGPDCQDELLHSDPLSKTDVDSLIPHSGHFSVCVVLSITLMEFSYMPNS